jgi:predicted nucleic acid-binding protein
LDKFTQNIRIIPIDSDVAKHYGDIRAKLSRCLFDDNPTHEIFSIHFAGFD